MLNNDYDDSFTIPPTDTTFIDFSYINHDHHNFDFSTVDFLNDPFNLNPFDPTHFPTHPHFSTSHASHASSNPHTFLNNNSCDIFQSFLKVDSPENHQTSGDHGGVPSPESNGSNKVLKEESQGSGYNKSINSSPSFDKSCIKNGVVDICFNLEGLVKNEANYVDGDSNKSVVLKRKKDSEDDSNSNSNVDTNCNKFRKSSDDGNCNVDTNFNKFRKSSDNGSNDGGGDNVSVILEEEEKRRARLEKNRESAQLSRQRKKRYVVELEDKVRIMHSTIQDLNGKISYMIAENSSLKQQIGGGGVVPSCTDQASHPPGMYPPPSMMFPWMPASQYRVKAEGSKVPLLPIPRLKSRQLASASKKTENKKSGGRTKKVASVSFVGLLFFMLLFRVLAPMVNVRYGEMKDSFPGISEFVSNGQYEKHNGKVLTVDGSSYNENFSKATPDINCKFNCAPRDQSGGGDPRAKHGGFEFVGARNGSEPLMASLYVPRNNKLVKIDGNLIIHSILASEKAITPHENQDDKKKNEETAIPGDLVPSDPRRNTGRRPRISLGSRVESENSKATKSDRQLHQWFREGLAGPMLSSGKCTEVFQFDVVSDSAPGAMIPATSATTVSTKSKNSTNVRQGLNRKGRKGTGNNSSSSMVVSVLFDPREAADAESDGVMRPKSVSRIFVVVLVDGVKYVTYSCRFPFKGEAVPHLVTT